MDCGGRRMAVILHYKTNAMKTQTPQIELNLQSFYSFAKLTKTEQETLLVEEGVFLDLDCEKETTTRLYFLQGFFVEEIFNRNLNEIVDVIPYKQGYKIESFIKSASCSLNERPLYFQYCIN